jgi:hypothetical protein
VNRGEELNSRRIPLGAFSGGSAIREILRQVNLVQAVKRVGKIRLPHFSHLQSNGRQRARRSRLILPETKRRRFALRQKAGVVSFLGTNRVMNFKS